MKKASIIAALALLLMACTQGKTNEQGTTVYHYADSCELLKLSLSLELPNGNDDASLQIRDSLIAEFIRMSESNDMEETTIQPMETMPEDPQLLVDYYGKAAFFRLHQLALNDDEQRKAYLAENGTDDPFGTQQWETTLTISKTTETARFVVYNAEAYVYYGGAHGGITGTGAITFDHNTGHKIARFLRPDAVEALQPMIRQGLLSYYISCGEESISEADLDQRLQIEGTLIPLPIRAAVPNATGDSLTLVYNQYEIACYADGMPTISLAVKDLVPYLTDEAKALLK